MNLSTNPPQALHQSPRIQKWFDLWGGPLILVPLLLAMTFGFYHYAWEPMILGEYPGRSPRWWWYPASLLVEAAWAWFITFPWKNDPRV